MQRLYSVFPRGSPGYGLLVLRLVLADYLISSGSMLLSSTGGSADAMLGFITIAMSWIVCGVSIAAGFLTPIVQVAAVSTQIIIVVYRTWAGADWLGAIGVGWPPRLSIAIGASLGLLGPGAYSTDAYLFGRHAIDIPPRSRTEIGQ